MQKLDLNKAQEVKGGRGHYHWICRDGRNFISKAYDSAEAAGRGMQNHINKYPAHANKCSVFYCEDGNCM